QPISVSDYRSAVAITHEYDAPVIAEGIRSILAVPVIVNGVPRAMLYGAHRTAAPIGGRAADVVAASARRLALELRIRDEVDRRVMMSEAHLVAADRSATAEQIREAHGQLRRIASDATTPVALGAQLRLLADRLIRPRPTSPSGNPLLSPRELDVLS